VQAQITAVSNIVGTLQATANTIKARKLAHALTTTFSL